MNDANPSRSPSRDQPALPSVGRFSLRPGINDDRSEPYEVILRLLLVVCVGAAMLSCGATMGASARLVNRTEARPVTAEPARVATAAATAFLHGAVRQGARILR